MKDPIIVARSLSNIIITVPAGNNEELLQNVKNNVIEIYGAGKVIERNELPYFYPNFINAINLKEDFENEDSIQNSIIYDVNKAKEILKDMWREVRLPLLQALDTEYIIALEKNDTNKLEEVAFKKQQLRDVTDLEIPNDFNEIQNFWPEFLGPHPYKINS